MRSQQQIVENKKEQGSGSCSWRRSRSRNEEVSVIPGGKGGVGTRSSSYTSRRGQDRDEELAAVPGDEVGAGMRNSSYT